MTQGFRAMNTDVTVIVPQCDEADEAAHARRVFRVFAESERRFSRFRPDSELSVLHRSTGPMQVSVELFDVLLRAWTYVELTDGLFDPCVGGSLVALGYDRSFAPRRLDREDEDPQVARSGRVSFLDVHLDPSTRSVTLPPNARLDLGGMVKGRTVDEAARGLPSPSVVEAGGDCVLRGAGSSGEGYLVEVEDPRDPAGTVLTLRVRDRALATSAPNRRRWRVGSEERHHLVDPRTGRSAITDLAQVTVLADTAELADVLAKTAYLLGEHGAIGFLGRQRGVAAVLVRHDGSARGLGELEVCDA